MNNTPKRTLYLTRWGALQSERSQFLSHWREISTYLLPYNGRFLVTDHRNSGTKKFNAIYDSTATRSLRVLAAGLMAGMTSPARPWFRLATTDRALMEYGPVKLWLNAVTEMMLDIFSRSNTYRVLHTLYEELGAFGTAASFMLSDYYDVIRHYALTAGEYAISTDYRGEVATLYREYEMTVSQMVGDFGRGNCSTIVQNLYDRGQLDAWVPVVHVIEPRTDRDTTKYDAKNMAWKSCYFELGGNEDKFLRESGFKRFPVLCPRWAGIGGDIYGNGPGMEALGDIKQLQHEQLRKAQGIDYQTKPPLQMPTALKNMPVSTLPGGAAFVDTATPHGGIKTMFEVNLDLSKLLMDIQDIRQRIRETFYVDLFLMLANDTSEQPITAREVAERHEEKLLMLGPVLERLHNELLKRKIENTFEYMLEARIVPPPPQEMHGQDLNIQFVSMLAQAQRAIGTNAIDRYVTTIGSIAVMQTNAGQPPTILDKLDTDELADQYADMLGVDPSLVVASDKVAIIRKQRAAQQAAAQQMAAAPAAAQAAKNLSQTDTSGKNALTDVIGQFSGYTSGAGA